jgi:hypothetical protein
LSILPAALAFSMCLRERFQPYLNHFPRDTSYTLRQWKELVELDYEHQVYSMIVARHHHGYFFDQCLYEKEVKMCCANIQRRLLLAAIRMNRNCHDAGDREGS